LGTKTQNYALKLPPGTGRKKILTGTEVHQKPTDANKCSQGSRS